MKQVTDIYVGNKAAWPDRRRPSEDTFAYFPLTSESQGNDMKPSGTKYDLTNTNVTFGTHQGVDCAAFTGGGQGLRYSGSYTLPSTCTISFWFYQTSIPSDTDGKQILLYKDGVNKSFSSQYAKRTSPNGMVIGAGDNGEVRTGINPTGYRCYVCISSDSSSSTIDIRLNGTHTSYTTNGFSGATLQWICLGNSVTGTARQYLGYLSEVIIESKKWSSDEKLAYYEQTKSKYGIS